MYRRINVLFIKNRSKLVRHRVSAELAQSPPIEGLCDKQLAGLGMPRGRWVLPGPEVAGRVVVGPRPVSPFTAQPPGVDVVHKPAVRGIIRVTHGAWWRQRIYCPLDYLMIDY